MAEERILAVVVLEAQRHRVAAGGAPVFVAPDAGEQNRMALALSRILDGMVHDLENGVYVIVRH
ncbi:MAG: hypothetical protein QHH27_02185 [Clostridia bacterium]|jgi:hypothetical protein|nr:hypothetical protein [Clostridia bacterium]MDH7572343.1 hypothetical protein [Clostridia bacterium]